MFNLKKRCMRSAVLVVGARLQAHQSVECMRSAGTAAATFSGIRKEALDNRVSNPMLNGYGRCRAVLAFVFPALCSWSDVSPRCTRVKCYEVSALQAVYLGKRLLVETAEAKSPQRGFPEESTCRICPVSCLTSTAVITPPSR